MKSTVLALAVMLFAESAEAQIVREMTPEKIREAITLGVRSKNLSPYRIQEKARFSWPPLIALYTTPFLRVALAANAATKQYRTFTEADVTAEMIAAEIQVFTESKSLGGGGIANVTTVVLLPRKAKGPEQVIRPVRTANATEHYKNLFGFTAEGQAMIATFPIDVWTEDKEVHVVYDAGIPNANPFGTGGLGGCTDCKSRLYLDKVR